MKATKVTKDVALELLNDAIKKPQVKSPKTVAERNAIITAALKADPRRAKRVAKGKKVAAEVVKATPKKKVDPVKLPHKNDHGAAGGADAAKTLGEMVKLDQIPRASTVKSPCQIVWETASEMQKKGGFTRKDVLAACMEKGVAYYTARTQYQQWKAAGDNDRKNAAKQATK